MNIYHTCAKRRSHVHVHIPFGWNIFDTNRTVGGLFGYSSVNSTMSLNVPGTKTNTFMSHETWSVRKRVTPPNLNQTSKILSRNTYLIILFIICVWNYLKQHCVTFLPQNISFTIIWMTCNQVNVVSCNFLHHKVSPQILGEAESYFMGKTLRLNSLWFTVLWCFTWS